MNAEPKRSPATAGVGSGQLRGEDPASVDPPVAGTASVDRPGGAAVANGEAHRGCVAAANGETYRRGTAGVGGVAEWAVLGEWLVSPPRLREVDLGVLREGLVFVGRARSRLVALEAEVIGEISRRRGDAGAEEILREDQKRSRSGARKAVQVAARLDWAPQVAGRLADGAITPEAAGLILEAGAETPVDHRKLLDAAAVEADDQFRRTLRAHVNERTGEQELQARRERQHNEQITRHPEGKLTLTPPARE